MMLGNRFAPAPGLRFLPNDDELIRYYLFNKVTGKPLSCEGLVNVCDLYGDREPWELWEMFRGSDPEEKDIYFFTKLKKKTQKGSRVNRRIGSGTWQGEDSGKKVSGIGFMKRFRYENNAVPEHHGAWIMHEFSLVDQSLLRQAQQESSDYVLCRIRQRVPAETKKKKRQIQQSEDERMIFGSSEDVESTLSKRLKTRQQAEIIEKHETELTCAISNIDKEEAKILKNLETELKYFSSIETEEADILENLKTELTCINNTETETEVAETYIGTEWADIYSLLSVGDCPDFDSLFF